MSWVALWRRELDTPFTETHTFQLLTRLVVIYHWTFTRSNGV